MKFNNFFDEVNSPVGSHSLTVLLNKAAALSQTCQRVAAEVMLHYSSEAEISHNLRRLGKSKAADLLEVKLPTTKQIRSGDLGEILATEYISDQGDYFVPINRLRWKDHRDMAMRGEDAIGFARDTKTGDLLFLKTESKSRAALATNALVEARVGLDKYDGKPSPNALLFIASQLFNQNNVDLADDINDAALNKNIPNKNIQHLLFTFSGNNPSNLLKSALGSYHGVFKQRYVGLCIRTHGNFIKDVYQQVIQNV